MSGFSFSPVRASDRASAVSTLVSAFTRDPVERWLFPDTQQYLAHFPEFIAAFGGEAFERGTVWQLGEFAAVAFWLPPGVWADADAIVAVLSESVAPEQHRDTFAVLEQMDDGHPTYPHWYLPWFGVKLSRQGTGLGRRLLAHCLAIVDADHLPAYLETPNPRTVAFYERHGFEVSGTAQVGSCPPITLMIRAAR